jgi:hypothetical protein
LRDLQRYQIFNLRARKYDRFLYSDAMNGLFWKLSTNLFSLTDDHYYYLLRPLHQYRRIVMEMCYAIIRYLVHECEMEE